MSKGPAMQATAFAHLAIHLNQLHFVLFPEGDVLPAVQLLLPEHPALGASARGAGGHAPVPAGVPAAPRTQAAARRIPAQARAAHHQVPAAAQGITLERESRVFSIF